MAAQSSTYAATGRSLKSQAATANATGVGPSKLAALYWRGN